MHYLFFHFFKDKYLRRGILKNRKCLFLELRLQRFISAGYPFIFLWFYEVIGKKPS